MTKKPNLAKPNVIPSRRVFIKGAAAFGAGGAVLAGINDGARADGDPIPVGQAAPLTDFNYGPSRVKIASSCRSTFEVQYVPPLFLR